MNSTLRSMCGRPVLEVFYDAELLNQKQRTSWRIEMHHGIRVEVFNGNIDKALRDLRHGIEEAGTLRALQVRRNHPRSQDRKRAKEAAAAARRKRTLRRKG
jgi:ribosomal protein S21